VFVYGFLKNDFVIIIANAVSLAHGNLRWQRLRSTSSWR
jgi:hypothetical protein